MQDIYFHLTRTDKPSPPRAPIDVSGMNDTSFTLSWEEPETDGGSKIIEYIVEIKEFHETDYRLLGSTNGNVPHILVTNVIKNKAYTFRIYAKNEVGISEALETEDKIVVSRRISKFFVQNFLVQILSKNYNIKTCLFTFFNIYY